MARNYAAVPHEYLEEMAELTDEEFGRLMRALLLYSRDGKPVEGEGNERFYARRVMNREDGLKASYEEIAERNRSNGRKGGRPKKQENPETQKNPKKPRKTEKNPEEPKETQKTQDEVEVEDNTEVSAESTSFATKRKNSGGTGESEGNGASAPAATAPEKVKITRAQRKSDIDRREKAMLEIYQPMAKLYSPAALPPELDDAIRRWIRHRANINRPLNDDAIAQLLRDSTDLEMEHSINEIVECFNYSIRNSYLGVFFDSLKSAQPSKGRAAVRGSPPGPREQNYDFGSLEKSLAGSATGGEK